LARTVAATDSRGAEGRTYEGRSSENRGFANPVELAARSFETRSFKDRAPPGPMVAGGFRPTVARPSGTHDRFGATTVGPPAVLRASRPRTDWTVAAQPAAHDPR